MKKGSDPRIAAIHPTRPSPSGGCGLPAVGRAVDELHDGHRGRIARAWPELQDAQVAPWTSLETRPQVCEQFADNFLVAQPVERKPALGDAVFLRKGDERLNYAAQLLRFGQGCLD